MPDRRARQVPGGRDQPGGFSQMALAFWDGFATPSTAAVIPFLTAFLVSLAGLFWFYSPGAIAGPMGAYLARSAADAESFVTREALRLGRTLADRPRLLLLGPSTVAQAFGDGQRLAADIADRTGQEWGMGILTTPLQSPFDQLALIENALAGQGPDSPPVVVVVGMGLQRLGWTEARLMEFETQGRIGLRSLWVDAEVAALGQLPRRRTGIYLIDNYRFVIANGSKPMIRLVLMRPARRVVDIYSKAVPMPADDRPRDIVATQIREGQANADSYFALHARMAERIGSYPNVRLVFIDEALSPEFIAKMGLGQLEADTSQRFAAFAESAGAEFWPVMADAGLAGGDYYDDLHIMQGAPQDRVSAALADRFAGSVATPAGPSQ